MNDGRASGVSTSSSVGTSTGPFVSDENDALSHIRLPKHWHFRRLKFTSRLRYGLGQPPPEIVGGVPFIRATNVDRGIISLEGMVYVDPTNVPASRNAYLSTNEILIVRSGALTGDSAIVPAEFSGSLAGFDVVITPTHIHPKFLAWTLLTPFVREAQLDLLKTRAAQPHLNVEEVGSVVVCVPSDKEQAAIAVFLDRETAETDALVAKYENFIGALQERKTAFVARAVTKGLNFGAPMKASGVEWLGEIPRHWKITPLKYCVRISSGSTPDKGNAEYWQDGDIPWASAKDLKVDTLFDTQDHITEAAVSAGIKIISEDAVLIVVRGMILARTLPVVLTGKPMAINQDLKALRANADLRPKFLSLVLRSIGHAMIATADTSGHGTKVLRTEDWTRFAIPVPPIDEQDAIITTTDAEEKSIDDLIAITRRCIEVCKERRSALITAAVTGQIDVKSYAEKTSPYEDVA
jgi:type I restriction enzyme, S subunit